MKKIVCLFFLINLCHGQVNDQAFLVQWVNTDDGLNQISVSNCIADHYGFVWIATNQGLYKYDWQGAIQVKNPKYPNIGRQRIPQLYKDPITGIIYFRCSPEEKNYCIENTEIKLLTASEGLFIQNEVFVRSNNPLFSAITRYINSNEAFNKGNFIFNNNALINKTFYYTLSKNKIVILNKKGTARVIDFPNAEKAMIFKSQGHVFIANKAKIVKLTGTTINYDHVKVDKIIEAFIASEDYLTKRHAFVFFDDQFYINFSNVLYKIVYKNNKLTASFVFDAPINEYFKFSYSKMHDLYVCGSSTSGMSIIRNNNFNTIATQKNRNGYSDYVVVKKNDNWYNLTGWIYTKSTKKLNNRRLNNMASNMRFLLEYNNDYYFESDDRRLTSLTNLKNILPFKTGDNVMSVNFLTGYTYLNDKLWTSKDRTLFGLTNNKFIVDSLITKQLKRAQVINALNTINGHLLVATTNGVFLYKPFSGKKRYVKGLENVNARYIKHIDKSNYWVGCYGEGLYLVANNKAHHVTDNNIDITTAHAIEEDTNGNLWISTNNGLLTIDKKLAIQKTLQKKPIESYLFSTSDGLPTNEFNGGGTFPSLQDTDGTIGFPSMKGFVWFHPKNVKKQFFKGSIIIDEVISDNTVIRPVENNIYKIPNDAALLTIKFNYGYSGNKKNLTVSYKFEDQESWSIVEQNVIQIPRYKKGSHKLQIKIKTHGFEDNHDVIKTVEFDFEERIFELGLFWIIIAMIAIFIVIMSYAMGVYFRKEKERILKEKIDEKTAQLSQNITQLENSNEQLKTSKLQLSQALSEREMLLREIHHRVKNNLQIIMSLLKIQANEGNSKNIEDFLEISESRIQSMALIHQSLYEHSNLDSIVYQDYVEQLVSHLMSAMGSKNDTIAFQIEAKNIFLEIETAISLGLVLNELLTNTFKYAFPKQQAGEVNISIVQLAENDFELIYSDNGIGYNPAEQTAPSFGLELVRMLVKELKGTLVKVPFSGTKYCLSFRQTNCKK